MTQTRAGEHSSKNTQTKTASTLFRTQTGKDGEARSRRTITIRPDTAGLNGAPVGTRKFSVFVQTALDHQPQRERIDQWLAEQEAAHGPLSAEDLGFAENVCRSRKFFAKSRLDDHGGSAHTEARLSSWGDRSVRLFALSGSFPKAAPSAAASGESEPWRSDKRSRCSRRS